LTALEFITLLHENFAVILISRFFLAKLHFAAF